MTRQRRRAVVMGASMAGLAAARALADTFDEVVVVERDRLPVEPGGRKGTPQARHVHALLPSGLDALEALFPGLGAQLVGAGAAVGDGLGNMRWVLGGHRFARGHAGRDAVQCTRPLLESLVRDRVRAIPNVAIIDRCDVVGFVAASGRVEGVRILRRADDSAEETLVADLVVDCSGRASRTPARLVEMGYPAPEEERISVSVGYATCRYAMPGDVLGGDRAILIGGTSDLPRGAALFAVEGDEWMLTLAGMAGDHPPLEPEAFEAWAATLQVPDVADAIGRGRRLDDPAAFRYPASVRHRYEAVRRFPDGLLVMGDALASFNPVYGQGMSVAALEAVELHRALRANRTLDTRRFSRQIARIVDVAWELASGADLAFAQVEGRRTAKTRISIRYVARVHAAAAHDPVVGAAFLRVASLVDPPQRLMRPGLLARVLRGSRRTQSIATSVGPAVGGDRVLTSATSGQER
jgi:2-polyprenyl-6-methoxyphenol hydroxylase-like FAD-dependent oxidoreductase